MKLRFFMFVQSVAGFLIRDLQRTEQHVQNVRIWAWHRATIENLRTCNQRQPARERFC